MGHFENSEDGVDKAIKERLGDPLLPSDTAAEKLQGAGEESTAKARINDSIGDDDEDDDDYENFLQNELASMGDDAVELWNKIKERDARLARQREEETRVQALRACSLEGLRSDIQALTEASTEVMRSHHNGEALVKLRDSIIHNKKMDAKIKQLENENEMLKKKLSAALDKSGDAVASKSDGESSIICPYFGGIDADSFNYSFPE